MEVYRFGQYLGERFSPISTFVSFLSSRAFRDAPNLHFRCADPNQRLLNLLKMLLLFLPKSTRVYFTCGSLSLRTMLGLEILAHYIFFSLACFRAFRDSPHSRYRCRHLKLCLLDFFKMLDSALWQIYTRVFHLWKTIHLDFVWVGYFCPYQLSFRS